MGKLIEELKAKSEANPGRCANCDRKLKKDASARQIVCTRLHCRREYQRRYAVDRRGPSPLVRVVREEPIPGASPGRVFQVLECGCRLEAWTSLEVNARHCPAGHTANHAETLTAPS